MSRARMTLTLSAKISSPSSSTTPQMGSAAATSHAVAAQTADTKILHPEVTVPQPTNGLEPRRCRPLFAQQNATFGRGAALVSCSGVGDATIAQTRGSPRFQARASAARSRRHGVGLRASTPSGHRDRCRSVHEPTCSPTMSALGNGARRPSAGARTDPCGKSCLGGLGGLFLHRISALSYPLRRLRLINGQPTGAIWLPLRIKLATGVWNGLIFGLAPNKVVAGKDEGWEIKREKST
jgi:hypothetical protein